MEYSYALQAKKPFVSLVVEEKPLHAKIAKDVLLYDERENPERYKAFKELVLEKHCSLWTDEKDIKNAILRKLPEWNSREDLKGWVPASSALNPDVANELARLSRENERLRAEAKKEDFEGLSFDQLIAQMRATSLDSFMMFDLGANFLSSPNFTEDDVSASVTLVHEVGLHLGGLFEAFHHALGLGLVEVYFPATLVFDHLRNFDLVEQWGGGSSFVKYRLTSSGRRLRNTLLTFGTGLLEERIDRIWR